MQIETLVRDGKPVAEAIAAVPADPAAIMAGIAHADAGIAAACALAAGRHGLAAAALAKNLGRDGVSGRTAAWALGIQGAERELVAALDGGLDQRDNAYYGLAVLAAAGKASPGLTATMRSQVTAEIAKVKSGGTCLGEHAVRVLAVLGDAEAAALAQQVIDADRFCDRFELSRLKKICADGGKDRDTIAQLSASWEQLFADHLAPAPKPEPMPEAKPDTAKPAATKPVSAKTQVPVSDQPPSYDLAAEEPPAEDEIPADGETAAGGGAPVDWKAFAASPECAALPPQIKQFANQLGPMLEQLAARAVQAHLADLSRDEFAALILQVLPQALPPQAVQAALSPQAMHAFQAIAKFLIRTKAATQGDGLLEGVQLVRKAMTEQIKRAGILNGPDYSDPDEKKAPSPLIK